MDNKNLNKFSTFLFYISILTFIIAFNFAHNPPSGWYQQFVNDIDGRNIVDVTFTDSLTGYLVTTRLSDSSLILKTTNGGDNWFKIHAEIDFIYTKIQFINQNTGYVGGSDLIKTTNGGTNWFSVNIPVPQDDIFVLNEDTIWTVFSEGLVGGVFRTTNGGTNWERQLHLGSQNPSHIYMYNGRLGFTSTGNGTYKTTNSGVNWFNLQVTSFSDIYFSDSLTGWKNNQVATIFQKTIDGGLNWITYNLPPEQGNILISRIVKFDNIINDTIWGVGSTAMTGSGNRGLIYKTTNSGQSWGYQLPDTVDINIFSYQHVDFNNYLIGWAYTGNRGVHTVTSGDTTIITNINNQNIEISKKFILHQNYPNPFNPNTIINYQLSMFNYVELNVYNNLGKQVTTLVNKKQNSGAYQVEFDGNGLPSGVYFYSLFIGGERVDTKKMVLVR